MADGMTLLLGPVAFSQLENESTEPIHRESIMAKAIGKARDYNKDATGTIKLMDSRLPPIEAMQPQMRNCYGPDKFYNMFARVWSSNSLQRLSMLTSKGANNRGGFDISLSDHMGQSRSPYCGDSLEHSTTTVEFRDAQMSFDILFIRNWAESLAAIFELTTAPRVSVNRRGT
ncbi:hypothetical protein B0J13DRAFT_620592 [Dactylonectria estremocensis]|uniref:Uncharacterized protein n=1 Tax=Dactylonectria estremocensis TaxID=1079267 RepID=A0A9P9J524_9HYPO|nr:hypothetical protein B0J13DRAFT_620592 [Dactylonectria estremocensis]